MHRIPRPLLRAAAAASLLVLAGVSAGAQAQTTARPAPTSTTQAPTRIPPGARGEDPHYPASGTQGQDSGDAQPRRPGHAPDGARRRGQRHVGRRQRQSSGQRQLTVSAANRGALQRCAMTSVSMRQAGATRSASMR